MFDFKEQIKLYCLEEQLKDKLKMRNISVCNIINFVINKFQEYG